MKKKPLIVAAISGTIYQANILKDGTMSDTRVDMTDDVLRATNEWFISNGAKSYAHDYKGGSSHVFHTTDDDKAAKIKKILKSEDK